MSDRPAWPVVAFLETSLRFRGSRPDVRMKKMADKTNLVGLDADELTSFLTALGEPAYRGKQIFATLQQRRLQSFDEMTDLPKGLRETLKEKAAADTLTVESKYVS